MTVLQVVMLLLVSFGLHGMDYKFPQISSTENRPYRTRRESLNSPSLVSWKIEELHLRHYPSSIPLSWKLYIPAYTDIQEQRSLGLDSGSDTSIRRQNKGSTPCSSRFCMPCTVFGSRGFCPGILTFQLSAFVRSAWRRQHSHGTLEENKRTLLWLILFCLFASMLRYDTGKGKLKTRLTHILYSKQQVIAWDE